MCFKEMEKVKETIGCKLTEMRESERHGIQGRHIDVMGRKG